MKRLRNFYNENEQFNTALYIRLSHDDGKENAESVSISNQRKMLREFAEEHSDLHVVDEYIDDGFSGTNFNRPSFQRMIVDIESGLINCVVVKDLSRFGRDYIDGGYYLDRYFPEKKVRFISIGDNMDSMSGDSGMITPIKQVINHYYAVDISNKVQGTFKVKQRKGEFCGAFASYGFVKDPEDKSKLLIDDEAADVVRRIFSMYLSGNGKIRIAHILNEEGVPCPTMYKQAHGLNYHNCNQLDYTTYWTYSSIHNILNNEMYIGTMVQGKTTRRMNGKAMKVPKDKWVRVENVVPAIIDKEVWKETQELLSTKTKAISFEQNLSAFRGVLKCGDCGRALSKTVMKNRDTYYTCGTYKKYGVRLCSSHYVTEKRLREIVCGDLNQYISAIQDMQSMVDAERLKISDVNLRKLEEEHLQLELEKATKELRRISEQKADAYTDYKDGLIESKEAYLAVLEKFTKKEKTTRKKIENLNLKICVRKENVQEQVKLESWITKLLSVGTLQPEDLDYHLISQMIDKIQIYEDKRIVVTYKFKEQLESIFEQEQSL